ncbi:MAG: PAS domain S-box protein [Candidatus Aminicenantaceae bacterium]
MVKVRVLYIEDNDIQRKTLASGLRSKGHSVSVATSGRTGLRLFNSKAFEVILCDLNMPEMDGLGVLENIRRKDPDIPFIILSAHGTVPLAVKAIKKGANYFVLKPVEINQITITIEQIIEKTKLQKKMQDSQNTLQMVAENVPDIIYSLDPKGEFISISPSAELALGYKPSEFIGKSVFEIIHPDDRERVKESFVRSIKGTGPKVKTLQFRMVSKTGKIKHYEISRRMVVENGQIIRNDGIARDVTHKVELEQKLLEYSQELINANLEMLETQQKLEDKNAEMEELLNELSKNKDELQTIIDTNPGIIILADNEGIIKASNRAVTDYFGFLPDEIINTGFDEFIAKIKGDIEDFDTFRNYLDECKEAPYCSGEYDISEMYKRGIPVTKHKSGILSPTCCRVQDKDGNKIGHLWIFSDISFLKQADEQVHTIVNASPIPTIISRIEDGKILYVNEELAQLVGMTSKELIGMNTPDFYYNKEDRKIVVESLKRDGYLRDFETRIKKVDGTVVWMIFSLVATEMGGEKVLLGWLYDISERKKSEETIALRLKYEVGLAACSQALLGDDTKSDVLTEALNHLLEASGTSRVYIFKNFDDPKHGLCLRLTHEVCTPGVSSNLDNPILQHGVYKKGFMRWQETLSQGKPILGFIESFPQSEKVILEPQGILSILVLPLWISGQWYGFIGYDDVEIRRDWNEEDIRLLQTAAEMVGVYIEGKKVDLALRESEERFRSYVEKANDIIYALTPEGIFSYVSPNWTEILGHDVTEVQGKSFVLFVHPDDLEACSDFFQKVMIHGQKQSGIEYRVKHKNGKWRWHTSSASPLKDDKGNVLSYIGIAHDITQMKEVMDDLEKTNQDLKETQAQLVQSEKMASLGSLVAGIAHEINTPIGAVSSMYDTLSRTLRNLQGVLESKFPTEYEQLPELKSTFKIIHDSNHVIKTGTERVTTLVKRLKSFARLDEAELKIVDIHEGLEDTLTLIHHEIKHNITVTKNFGKIPPISCYPGQLNQVFLNLLINSKHAIKGKGTIDLTTFARNNKVHIVINDSGIGIPKQNLTKIFDPGFTTKGRGVGAGLGLSICYQIIQDHRGEIKAKSEVGKGTEFTIILPMDLENILENEKNRD